MRAIVVVAAVAPIASVLLPSAARADESRLGYVRAGDDCRDEPVLVSPPPIAPDHRVPCAYSRATADDRLTHGFDASVTHAYLELRLGAVGLSPFRPKDGGSLRYGAAVEATYGIAWAWLDLGLVGRFGAAPGGGGPRYVAFGPEIATRTYLGAASTLRLGVAPLYAAAWGGDEAAHGRVGADAIAQVLFTLDEREKTSPVWRAGVGLRAGRWWSVASGEGAWTLGLDLVVRSWW